MLTCIRVTATQIGFVISTLTQLQKEETNQASTAHKVDEKTSDNVMLSRSTEGAQIHSNYPARAATVRDWNIPTDPSPSPLLDRSRAFASALFRNIW